MVHSGNAVVDQLDELFGGGGQSVLSADGIPDGASSDFTPTVSDGAVQAGGGGADQLDELFGGSGQSILSADEIPAGAAADFTPTAAGGGVTEGGGADQLDELFGGSGQAVLSADEIPADIGGAADLSPIVPSGNAVVDQLDELFGGQAILPPAAMPAGDTHAALDTEVPSGNAVVDQLDALFGGRTILPPAAAPEEEIDGAPAEPDMLNDITSELDLPVSSEINDALSEISGDDIEGQLDAMFGGSEPAVSAPLNDRSASADQPPVVDDEAALVAALEAEGAAAPPAEPPPDEAALIVDGVDAVPAEEPAQPSDAGDAKKLPSSIVLDENGVDIAATPTSDDIEDRIDDMFGMSDPAATKDPLVIDEDEEGTLAKAEAAPPAPAAEREDLGTATDNIPTDNIPTDNDEDASFLNAETGEAAGAIEGADMTGDDVEERLAEMFGASASDTTTEMTIEEVMAVDVDSIIDGGGVSTPLNDRPASADEDVSTGDLAEAVVDTTGIVETDDAVDIAGIVGTDDVVDTTGIVETDDAVDTTGIVETDDVVDTTGIVETDDAVDIASIVGTDDAVDTTEYCRN